MAIAAAVAAYILMALSLVGCAFWLAAAALVGRHRAVEPGQGPAAWPAVSVLKPLHGVEPGLAENLQSFLAQDYPAPVQLVLGLQDPADPALPIARAVAAGAPDRVDVVVSAAAHGTNRKVSNLINLTEEARHPLLVQSDSDIAVDPRYLRRVVAALSGPEVGLVTALYLGEGRAGGWSRLAAMNLSYGFLPNVVVGVALGLAKPCMGSTVAITRNTFERVGGWRRVADVLADDFEIGRAVRESGLRTVLARGAVVHACSETSLAEVFRHELRWALTVRGIDPAGFYGSVVTHAVPLAGLALILSGVSAAGAGVFLAALAARLWLKFRVDRSFERSAGAWWLLPARDMLSGIVFVAALAGRSVEWRGSRYTVATGGALRPADARRGQD